MLLFLFLGALVILQTGLSVAFARGLKVLVPTLQSGLRGIISFVLALPFVIGAALLFLIWLGEHVRSVHTVS